MLSIYPAPTQKKRVIYFDVKNKLTFFKCFHFFTHPEQTNHSTESLERKWHPLEEGSKGGFKGSAALLVELEDQVAQAAANVQNAQSEVRKTLQLSWNIRFVLRQQKQLKCSESLSLFLSQGLVHRGQDCCPERCWHANG